MLRLHLVFLIVIISVAVYSEDAHQPGKLKLNLTGNFQSLNTEPDDDDSSGTFAGGLSFNYEGDRWGIDGQIRLGTNTTVESDDKTVFGRSLLIPGNGANSLYIFSHGKLPVLKDNEYFKGRIRVIGEFCIGQVNWKYKDSTTEESVDNIPIFSPSIGLGYVIIDKAADEKNDFSWLIYTGYTSRHISGDFNNRSGFGELTIGSEKSNFFGLWAGSRFFVNDIMIGVDYAYLKKRDRKIDGLTGGQLIFSVSAKANLYTM